MKQQEISKGTWYDGRVSRQHQNNMCTTTRKNPISMMCETDDITYTGTKSGSWLNHNRFLIALPWDDK